MPTSNSTHLSEDYYLKSVALSGYRTIRDVKVDFKPGLNIIIGRNGVGKTNFMWFLKNAIEYRYEKLRNFRGSKVRLEYNGEREDSIEIENSRFFNGLENTDKEELKIIWNNRTEELPILNKIIHSTYLIPHGIIFNKASFLDTPFEGTAYLNGYPSFNASFDYEYLREGSIIIQQLTIALENINFLDIQKSSSEEDFKLNVKNTILNINKVLENIKPNIRKYTPIQDFRFGEDFGIYINPTENSLTVKNLLLEFKINDSWMPFTSLSDGTKRAFLIVADLSLPRHYIEKYLYSTLFLIEEPELGIHPHQLFNLMQLIKEESKERQIIVSTHSPDVLNILNKNELDRLIIAEYDLEKGTQLRHLTGSEKKSALIYFEEFGYLGEFWKHKDIESKPSL